MRSMSLHAVNEVPAEDGILEFAMTCGLIDR